MSMNIDHNVLKKNIRNFVDYTLNNIEIGKANVKKIARKQTNTFKRLEEKYDIKWDENAYYTPDFDKAQDLRCINLKDIYAIRDYITYKVNEKYMQYCEKNNVKPEGMIVVPEHLYKRSSYFIEGNDRDRLLEEIDNNINKYIDEDGKVYNKCHHKQTSKALNDINNIKNSAQDEKIPDYSTLLPSYGDRSEKFFLNDIKTGNIKNLIGENEGLDDKIGLDNVMQYLRYAEDVINEYIPPKYICNCPVIIDNEKCLDYGKKEFYVEHFQLSADSYEDFLNKNIKRKIYLATETTCDAIVHEYIHTLIQNNFYDGMKISTAVWDCIYELSKSRPIKEETRNGKFEYFYKVIDDNIRSYFTYMDEGKENYFINNEVLPVMFSALLGSNYVFKNCKIISPKIAERNEVERVIKHNFNEICDKYPELGALLLTFMRGDFK